MNTDEFNKIYLDYHQQIYAYVRNKTQSEYYAEEVVQLTFIKLWKIRKQIAGDVPINIQIYRIAKTVLIDILRSSERKEKLARSFHETSIKEEMILEVSKEFDQKETHLRIKKILSALPPMRKKVFEMSRFEEKSHKEISSELNITPKTVENHINLTLRYLKAFFI